MNSIKKVGIGGILVGLLFVVGATDVLAHCGMCGMGKKGIKAEASVSTKTFQATVICLGCTLKKEQGAKALCSVFGHKNALRTEDGRIWTILENKASTDLINSHDYAGKTIRIDGKKFSDARVIEVSSFTIIEQGAVQQDAVNHEGHHDSH